MRYIEHAAEFGVEFRRIVDDVEIGMTDPGFGCPIIQRLGQVQVFIATRMALGKSLTKKNPIRIIINR